MKRFRGIGVPGPWTGKWTATWVIMALNIVWYLVVESVSGRTPAGLVRAGAMVNAFVEHGQLFRLLSSVFVHVTITHLVVNMISLWTLSVVESMLGINMFLILYLASGIVGNLLNLVMGPFLIVSAGASGAIFGLFGAMLALAFRRILPSVVRNQLLFILAINVVLDATNGGIDWLAHLGGMITGILLTLMYVKGWRHPTGWRIGAAVLVALTMISLAISLFTPLPMTA